MADVNSSLNWRKAGEPDTVDDVKAADDAALDEEDKKGGQLQVVPTGIGF